MQDELDARLAEVDAALQRLASGTWSIDGDTGESIDPERFAAFPTVRTNR